MGCQIATIYTNLAALSVTVTASVSYGGANKTPTARALGNLIAQVNSADLPLRLISPAGTTQEGQESRQVTFKPSSGAGFHTALWRIADLLLWLPAGQGRLADVTPDLLAYMAAYLNTVGAARELIRQAAYVEDIAFDVGRFAFPAESDHLFFGVLATLTVRENFSA